jgi:3-phenylpropionate/cinnamic acid dioxygenase small subunit
MLDHHGVEQFLYREARLMDTHAYDTWLALWARTAHYWIPCNGDDIDVTRHVSLVNEDRPGLEDRVQRLKSGAHYAQDPPSRLSRVVSNVELDQDSSPDALVVHSTFNLSARGRPGAHRDEEGGAGRQRRHHHEPHLSRVTRSRST